jgi:hypothetical protein
MFKFTALTVSVAIGAAAAAFGAAYSLATGLASAGGATVTGMEWITILGATIGAAVTTLFHDQTPK